MQYNQAMEISPMFAVILLLAVIGFLMNYAVTLIERRSLLLGAAVERNGATMMEIDLNRRGHAMLNRLSSCHARADVRHRHVLLPGRSRPAQSLKKMTLVQMHPNMGIGEEVFLYAVPKRLGYFAAEGLDVDIAELSRPA